MTSFRIIRIISDKRLQVSANYFRYYNQDEGIINNTGKVQSAPTSVTWLVTVTEKYHQSNTDDTQTNYFLNQDAITHNRPQQPVKRTSWNTYPSHPQHKAATKHPPTLTDFTPMFHSTRLRLCSRLQESEESPPNPQHTHVIVWNIRKTDKNKQDS